MKILKICASLLLTYSTASYACMKDVDAIKESWNMAATKKTFSTTGCVIAEIENKIPLQFSGVLIDPWTVLTCAHELDAQSPNTGHFSLSPDVVLNITNDGLNFEESVQLLDPTRSSRIANFIVHPSFKLIKSENGSNEHKGYDLAILKLQTPLNVNDDFLTVSQTTPNDGSSRRGFALGYYRFAHTFDGRKRILLKEGNTYLTRKLVLEENNVEFKAFDQTFGSMHLSPTGTMDTCVPQQRESKYSGLIQLGMSGGPLLAQNQDTKKFEIVGINSRVFAPYIDPSMYGNVANKPIYNVWASVASVYDWIKEHMGETPLVN